MFSKIPELAPCVSELRARIACGPPDSWFRVGILVCCRGGLRAGGRYERVRPVLEPSGMQIFSSAVGSLTCGVHARSTLHQNIAEKRVTDRGSPCAGPTNHKVRSGSFEAVGRQVHKNLAHRRARRELCQSSYIHILLSFVPIPSAKLTPPPPYPRLQTSTNAQFK
jgi:hypothetical protein